MSTHTEWKTAWDADNPLHIEHSVVSTEEGPWLQGPRPPFESRDLGLSKATQGKMGAHHLRRASGSESSGEWQSHDVDFQWLFVTRGSFEIERPDGSSTQMKAGDSAYLPANWPHREASVSADFEALEVVAPAEHATESVSPSTHTSSAESAPVFNHDTPEAYVRGDGPRSYFEYRDLGLRGPTEGRIHIHVVRSATEEPMEGGTGDHHHSMSQWFMPIKGWADIEVDGGESRRMFPGDLMCISSGQIHNVPLYSSDYATLEMCVPAEYETVANG